VAIRGLLIDVDGVLIQGGAALPGAPEALRALAERGVPHRLVTNTTQRGRATLATRLVGLGFAVEAADLVTPAAAAARFLRGRGASAYLATLADTRVDFLDAGVTLDDAQPDYVVLGDLGEELGYAVLTRILRLLLGGAQLIALGRTRIWQAPDGPALDVGPVAALFEVATGREALTFGKPAPATYLEAAGLLGLNPDEVAMVGDDAEVDVAAAKRAGLGAAILVQGGKYRHGDERRFSPPPDALYPSFAAFVAALLDGSWPA